MPNKQATIKVWDMPTRIFHWCLVGGIFLCWLSMEMRWLWLHQSAGLSILFLLCYRIIWGFIGSSTARFRQFIRSPHTALCYLKRSLHTTGNSTQEYHHGHNPAGGWMVLFMLSSLLLQVVCGLFANDDIGFYGPLADQVVKQRSDLATIIHIQLFNVLLALTWLHLVAVFFYVLVKKHNLVKAMINGRKPCDQVGEVDQLYFASGLRIITVALIALSLPLYLIL